MVSVAKCHVNIVFAALSLVLEVGKCTGLKLKEA